MRKKYKGLVFISIICGILSGCTSQKIYGIGQSYERNQCLQIPDKFESDRCLSKINTSYDKYKRETDAGSK